MFGKVKKLQAEIEAKDSRIESLKGNIERLEKKLASFIEWNDGTPEDCHRGSWCEHCEYVKSVCVARIGIGCFTRAYFCGKGDICKNFAPKEKPNDLP